MKEFFKQRATVLFYGDSITDATRDRENPNDLGRGYAEKAAKIYTALYPDSNIRFINKGVGGNRLCDLLERYGADVRPVQPDFVSLLIGINDTWRRFDRGLIVTEAEFETQYRDLLSRIRSDFPNAAILIMAPFLFSTDPAKKSYWDDLAPKVEIVQKLALEMNTIFIPTGNLFENVMHSGYTAEKLSEDGVHPTNIGHAHLAIWWLQAIGSI